MKLSFINPDAGVTEKGLRERRALLKTFARPDTEVTMVCPVGTDICVDSALDAALVVPEIVRLALAARDEGADAVCLYCFSDPGIDACREVLDIPVVGGAQASVLLAAQLANSFSVITTSARRVSQKRAFARALGADPARLASVRAVEMPPGVRVERAAMIETLAAAVEKCVTLDGADAAVLGCLSFAGTGRELSRRAGVPVIDPAAALVTTAEAIVAQGLCHSGIGWPAPPARGRRWSGGSVNG